MGKKASVKMAPPLRTGVPGIDIQHNQLFLMFNTLLEGLEKGKVSVDSAYALASDIIAYLKSHCVTEENLLDMIGFPRTAEHKAQHSKIISDQRRKLRTLKNKELSDMGNFVRDSRDILITHFSVFDSEYTAHIDSLIELRNKFNITALKARVLAE